MQVEVRLFALLRELVGSEKVTVEVPAGGTVADVWKRLEEEHPELRAFRASRLFAVNGDYAADHRSLDDGDEVAVLPPLAGG